MTTHQARSVLGMQFTGDQRRNPRWSPRRSSHFILVHLSYNARLTQQHPTGDTTLGIGPGTQLGSYEIASLIGKGGMGEVYRARDTKLKRDVALKVLPEIFAGDPDRMARFQREAEVLASLNHPNIAHIYGVEERALAMELVDVPGRWPSYVLPMPARDDCSPSPSPWRSDMVPPPRSMEILRKILMRLLKAIATH